ncbi:MAG: hypothetical protein ACYDEV_08460 [Acidiferrobacter sp.]
MSARIRGAALKTVDEAEIAALHEMKVDAQVCVVPMALARGRC